MFTKKVLLVIVVLAFTQLACGIFGGAQEPPEESQPDFDDAPISTEVTIDSQPEEIATEASAVTEPPTAEESTSTEAGVETVSGLCSHPYFPVNEELIWTYQITETTGTTSFYMMEFTDLMEDSFVIYETFPNSGSEGGIAEIEMKWLCTEEGLLATEYGQLSLFDMGEEAPVFTYESLEASGVNLPVPDNWVIGSTWQTNYLLKGLTQIEGVGEITSTTEIKIENEIVGVESITVEAGTFDEAVKIEGTNTFTMTSFMMGMSTPFNFTVETETWYVKNIGLVKTQENDLNSVTQLFTLEEKEQ